MAVKKSTTKKTVTKKEVTKKPKTKTEKTVKVENFMFIQTHSGELFIAPKEEFVKGEHPDHLYGGYWINKTVSLNAEMKVKDLKSSLDKEVKAKIFIPIPSISYIGEI
jgi:hypothetical protein